MPSGFRTYNSERYRLICSRSSAWMIQWHTPPFRRLFSTSSVLKKSLDTIKPCFCCRNIPPHIADGVRGGGWRDESDVVTVRPRTPWEHARTMARRKVTRCACAGGSQGSRGEILETEEKKKKRGWSFIVFAASDGTMTRRGHSYDAIVRARGTAGLGGSPRTAVLSSSCCGMVVERRLCQLERESKNQQKYYAISFAFFVRKTIRKNKPRQRTNTEQTAQRGPDFQCASSIWFSRKTNMPYEGQEKRGKKWRTIQLLCQIFPLNEVENPSWKNSFLNSNYLLFRKWLYDTAWCGTMNCGSTFVCQSPLPPILAKGITKCTHLYIQLCYFKCAHKTRDTSLFEYADHPLIVWLIAYLVKENFSLKKRHIFFDTFFVHSSSQND